MIIKISKVKTYNWRIGKKIIASISGEYWITDTGEIIYSDSDNPKNEYGHNLGHSDMINYYIYEKNTPEEFRKYDIPTNFFDFLTSMAKKNNIKFSDNRDVTELHYAVEDKKEFLKSLGISDEDIKVLTWNMDPIYYGYNILNWKRVVKNNIETQYLTESDIQIIKNGLLKILDYEGKRKQGEKFNIETASNRKFYVDIPFSVIEYGSVSDIIEYENYNNINMYVA